MAETNSASKDELVHVREFDLTKQTKAAALALGGGIIVVVAILEGLDVDGLSKILAAGLGAVGLIAVIAMNMMDVHSRTAVTIADMRTKADLKIAELTPKSENPEAGAQDEPTKPSRQIASTGALAAVTLEGGTDTRYVVLGMIWDEELDEPQYLVAKEGARPIIVKNSDIRQSFYQWTPPS